MKSMRTLLSLALLLATVLPASAYTHARRGPTSPNLFRKRSSSRMGVHSIKPSGPRVMDTERATQIQAALIRSGYLTGTPSGHWDSESEAAMQKLQGAQGWQTKLTPDSRALILLGLGPNTHMSNAISETRMPEPAFASGTHLESTFVSQ